jgi:hypothetical protein
MLRNCRSRPSRTTSWSQTTCCTTCRPASRTHRDHACARFGGRGHIAELGALVPGWDIGRHAETFGLETGPGQLEAFFVDVRVERFDDGLAATEAEPVLAYIRSSSVYRGGDLAGPRTAVEAAIARYGAFHITKAQGLISCRKRWLG